MTKCPAISPINFAHNRTARHHRLPSSTVRHRGLRFRPSHRPTALALLISAAATGTLTLWGVAAAPDSVRTPLAWGAGAAAVLLSVCVGVAVHTLGTARRLRAQLAADAERFTSETSRLVSSSAVEAQRFTAETARIKGAAAAETARLVSEVRAENERIASAAAAEQARLGVTVDRLTARATRAETERSAAIAACANAAGRMQALSTSMLADLREMQYGTPTSRSSATCSTWTTAPPRRAASPTPSPC
ncbi:hypothetical protein SCALM49S_05805 [Streptomyces californicus]